MKQNTTPRIPSGFNEYLPAEQIEFNRMLDIIRATYEKYGFAPLDTPVLELSEVLLAKGGGETEQQVYRFERGKNDLTMRYDLTVPLARYVAQHEGVLTFPFRRYQMGKVYRAERAQAGRFREFYQCDIDTVGSDSPHVDAEFPAIINEIFEQFGVGEFTIRLNNRLILNGFFEGIGLTAVSRDVLRTIDKIEKITHDDFISELETLGLDNMQVTQVVNFTNITGTNDEVLAKLAELAIENDDFIVGTNKLRLLVESLRTMGVPESRFAIDLHIARGLDYYTGTVYETTLDEYPAVGSVCSGGRYDNLASNYTKTRLPGVGVSIGLTRLFYKLLEAGVVAPACQSLARVIVMPMDELATEIALETTRALREINIATITYTEQNNMAKKMKYADKLGVEYAVVIGEREVSNRVLAVKNMSSGEQSKMTLPQLVETLAKT